MLKFKVGDTVRITDRIHGHCFEIGDEIYIESCSLGGYDGIDMRGHQWSFCDDECVEIIKEWD